MAISPVRWSITTARSAFRRASATCCCRSWCRRRRIPPSPPMRPGWSRPGLCGGPISSIICSARGRSPRTMAEIISRIRLDPDKRGRAAALGHALNQLGHARGLSGGLCHLSQAHRGRVGSGFVRNGDFEAGAGLGTFDWTFVDEPDLAAVREFRDGASGSFALVTRLEQRPGRRSRAPAGPAAARHLSARPQRRGGSRGCRQRPMISCSAPASRRTA